MTDNRMLVAHELNAREREFASALVDGLNPNEAAARAGIPSGSGHALARHVRVAAAVHMEVHRRLKVEGAPVGLAVLLSVAKNVNAPAGVRVDAAKTLLSRAGHIEPRAEAAKPDTKDLSDMSQEELRKVIDQCESRLADQATPVNAPTHGLSPSQAIDMFE